MSVEPVIVSYSELDTWRQCPLKWAWGYRDRWTKEQTEGGALSRGKLWHEVMQAHYNAIAHVQDQERRHTLGEIRRPLRQERQTQAIELAGQEVARLLWDANGNQSDEQELVWWIYQGHVARWGADPQWRILAVEHEAIVPLPDRAGRRSRYHLKMKIDLVVEDLSQPWRNEGGKRVRNLWVVDHKSAKDPAKKTELDLDDQFGLYTWGMRQLGMPVIGSIHSAARTYRTKAAQPLEERFIRTPLFRSNKELDQLALDAYLVARESRRSAIYSSPNPQQCNWKCDFRDVHLAVRKGIDPKVVLRDHGFRIDKTRH